jgi:hypothetical protein
MMITCLDILYSECFKVINTLYCNVKLDTSINHVKLITECNTTFSIYNLIHTTYLFISYDSSNTQRFFPKINYPVGLYDVDTLCLM